MIKSVLIDDDSNLRSGMKALLAMVAPDVEIIGEADNVQRAVKIIENLKPHVVFLDIQLTEGTGFDVLEKLNEKWGKIESHIVFITAYEQYAIKAFKFSALDYLLKPVDPDELKKVVDKIKKVLQKEHDYPYIDILLQNIKKQSDSFKRIALSNSDGIHLISIDEIIRCESDNNYTRFFIKNAKPILVSKTLKDYEEMLTEQGFERIHQSHLVNIQYLKSYIKKDGGYVVMSDGTNLPVSQRKRERIQEIFSNLS